MTGCRHHTGVLLFLVGLLLLAPLTARAQQPKPGGTLRVAWEADVAGMDPRLSPGAQAGYIMGNLFNSLVSIDAELNYVPDLAESWEILEDGKVYMVELTVEVLDRPIFLRRWQRDRDWDQILGVSGAAFDSYQLSRVLDTRAGNNTLNHDDKQVDALIDRMKEAPTEAALLQAGYDFQRYVTESMMTCGIASLPFLQAARADVKGYVHLHGYKVQFETTWLDKP
jgi:ABC-type oligopeptide transport system substrate-binding subunit